METICETCLFKPMCEAAAYNTDTTAITGCYRYKQARPKSNADVLRAMSDEMMAKYFAELALVGGCPNGGSVHCHESCLKCWYDWLRKDAENE